MNNSTPRRRTPTTARFYSLALSIPGLTRPVWCTVMACGRTDAGRQARSVLRRIRGRATVPATVAALCLLALGIPADATAQHPAYTSGIDMVALTVTVTDATGRCVSGLTADNFAIFENGVPQAVALFGGDDIPVDVGLTLDTSKSMINALPVVKAAARRIVDRLRSGDRAAVIDIKETTRLPQFLTEDRGNVLSAIDALRPSGSTAFYDGVYTALREFERERRQHPGMRRQALVILSDGVDTSSRLGFDDVTELARTLDVTIYTIMLRDHTPSPVEMERDRYRQATWAMRSLASETGGLTFTPASVVELQRIYDAIAGELMHQYAIAYVSSAPPPGRSFNRVALTLRPPAQGTPRTRSGYLSKATSGSRTAAGGRQD